MGCLSRTLRRWPTLSQFLMFHSIANVISIVIILVSWSLWSSQESVATDEGFHDDSTNDTDPLVKGNKGEHRSLIGIFPGWEEIQEKSSVPEHRVGDWDEELQRVQRVDWIEQQEVI